jgi:rhodanese-related sulfurtransferase
MLHMALVLPSDEFESELGFAKPGETDAIVFYCKAGVRSAKARDMAAVLGFPHAYSFRGSMTAWTEAHDSK